jgi:hypothetical protein
MSWKKVKGLFWQAGDAGGAPTQAAAPKETPDAELSDEEFAKLLAGDPNSVPPD